MGLLAILVLVANVAILVCAQNRGVNVNINRQARPCLEVNCPITSTSRQQRPPYQPVGSNQFPFNQGLNQLGRLPCLNSLIRIIEKLLPSQTTNPAPAVCFEPVTTGPCFANFHRFHYDQRTRQCRSFVYGGCQGNGNNFQTRQQCESTCVIPDRRGLRGNAFATQRPTYTGVFGQTTTSRPLRCQQRADSGSCRQPVQRYYFNTTQQHCEVFTYGGCEGNGNNFQTINQCQRTCQGSTILG